MVRFGGMVCLWVVVMAAGWTPTSARTTCDQACLPTMLDQ